MRVQFLEINCSDEKYFILIKMTTLIEANESDENMIFGKNSWLCLKDFQYDESL